MFFINTNQKLYITHILSQLIELQSDDKIMNNSDE